MGWANKTMAKYEQYVKRQIALDYEARTGRKPSKSTIQRKTRALYQESYYTGEHINELLKKQGSRVRLSGSNELKRVLYGSGDTVIQKWRKTSEADLTASINRFVQNHGYNVTRTRYGVERQVTYLRMESLIKKYDSPELNKAMARYLAGRITLDEFNRIVRRWKETNSEYAKGKVGSP